MKIWGLRCPIGKRCISYISSYSSWLDIHLHHISTSLHDPRRTLIDALHVTTGNSRQRERQHKFVVALSTNGRDICNTICNTLSSFSVSLRVPRSLSGETWKVLGSPRNVRMDPISSYYWQRGHSKLQPSHKTPKMYLPYDKQHPLVPIRLVAIQAARKWQRH